MKLRVKDVVARYGLEANAVWLAADVEAPVEPWQQYHSAAIPIYVRAELGIRPDVEVIHLGYQIPSTVYTWWVRRAQEDSTAQAWPIGTPLAFVRADAEPEGRITIQLRHPLPSSSVEANLQGAYRRLRIESEVVWSRDLILEPLPDHPSSAPDGKGGVWGIPRAERGMENTVAVAHPAGAELTFLAPGEV